MKVRDIERSLAIGVAIELVMVIGFSAVILAPRWRLLAVALTATGDVTHLPEDWSPNGTALAMKTPSGYDVIAADGSVVLPEHAGDRPVWVDDRTLLALERVQDSSYQLVRIDTGDGRRTTIRELLAQGTLISDSRGHVAHQTDGETLMTTVLDPVDGTTVAELSGYRAVTWTSDGALIVKEREPRLANYYLNPGSMFHWRPGGEPRALGSTLVDAGNVEPLLPDGDALVCLCTISPPGTGRVTSQPRRSVYRVPLDGLPPTLVVPWPTEGGATPEIAWLDESSLVGVEGDGLSRISLTGERRLIPGLTTMELGYQRTSGHVHRLGSVAVAVLQDLVGGTDALLVVVDDQDHILMRRHFTGSLPIIAVDDVHDRALVSVEDRRVGQPSVWEPFMLEFR